MQRAFRCSSGELIWYFAVRICSEDIELMRLSSLLKPTTESMRFQFGLSCLGTGLITPLRTLMNPVLYYTACGARLL